MRAPACAFDQQQRGERIPRMHVRLEECVETPRSYVRKHQRAGTHVLHRRAGLMQLALEAQVRFQGVTRNVAGA
jgi:hypothetical protein